MKKREDGLMRWMKGKLGRSRKWKVFVAHEETLILTKSDGSSWLVVRNGIFKQKIEDNRGHVSPLSSYPQASLNLHPSHELHPWLLPLYISCYTSETNQYNHPFIIYCCISLQSCRGAGASSRFHWVRGKPLTHVTLKVHYSENRSFTLALKLNLPI